MSKHNIFDLHWTRHRENLQYPDFNNIALELMAMDYYYRNLTPVHLQLSCTAFASTRPHINTLRPRQDGRHFADAIFTCIFFNENCCILMKFSLKYIRKGPIDNNPALVQIMAWRRSGDKPLSETMMVRSLDLNELTHSDLNETANILQIVVSNALPGMKIFVLLVKFHWSLFLRV